MIVKLFLAIGFGNGSNGKVITSALAQTSNPAGQQKVTLDFQVDADPNDAFSSTRLSDAIGTQTLWHFEEVLGVNKVTSKINQSDSKGVSQTWDANGNLLSRTDAEGRTTIYTYNASNQKTSMTEASGTPQARTTTYEYVNADIDLLTKTLSPSVYGSNTKEVVNTYDANHNITAVTINGFEASGNPVTRATTFTHDTYGKVTSISIC